MRTLQIVKASPEQLPILEASYGTCIIRGAAGSGKTTSALLRLRRSANTLISKYRNGGLKGPIRILVLTFNRTLKGYIEELALSQLPKDDLLDVTVDTFAGWAMDLTQTSADKILDADTQASLLARLWHTHETTSLTGTFIAEEVDYAIGRFGEANLSQYIIAERTGRGRSPRVDATTRRRIIDSVIRPYVKYKRENGVLDWNDLASMVLALGARSDYDVIVADEVQDFSAQQVRAVLNQLKQEHFLTFVLDSAQSLYPRGFEWSEVGVHLSTATVYRLRNNYRNTIQIGQFAQPLLTGLRFSDDGTLPDFTKCGRSGRTPEVLVGTFSAQMRYIIKLIMAEVNLETESVGILHMKGGGWFQEARRQLRDVPLRFVELQRAKDWPGSSANIALCSLNSAKGLEFDHVFILGLNQQLTRHGTEEGDNELEKLRRLLAVGISRAKRTVILGHKASERSDLFDLLDPRTYLERRL